MSEDLLYIVYRIGAWFLERRAWRTYEAMHSPKILHPYFGNIGDPIRIPAMRRSALITNYHSAE